MKENERLTLKSVNGDVWLLDSEGEPYLLSVDGDDYNKALNRLAEYETVGTIEEFKALKEKSVAKKPEVDEFDYGEGFVCGECESFLHYVDDDDEHIRTNYCCHCGTRIDWSE